MLVNSTIDLNKLSDKELIINAYNLDPTIHKRTLAEDVIGCSYEYVRRLFAAMEREDMPDDEIESILDRDIQRELGARLLSQGVAIDSEIDIEQVDQFELEVETSKYEEYVVPAEHIADVRNTMLDIKILMDNMGDDAGKAVATSCIEKLDQVLEYRYYK